MNHLPHKLVDSISMCVVSCVCVCVCAYHECLPTYVRLECALPPPNRRTPPLPLPMLPLENGSDAFVASIRRSRATHNFERHGVLAYESHALIWWIVYLSSSVSHIPAKLASKILHRIANSQHAIRIRHFQRCSGTDFSIKPRAID